MASDLRTCKRVSVWVSVCESNGESKYKYLHVSRAPNACFGSEQSVLVRLDFCLRFGWKENFHRAIWCAATAQRFLLSVFSCFFCCFRKFSNFSIGNGLVSFCAKTFKINENRNFYIKQYPNELVYISAMTLFLRHMLNRLVSVKVHSFRMIWYKVTEKGAAHRIRTISVVNQLKFLYY